MKLDLTIQTLDGRKQYLEEYFSENEPSNRDLEQAADYLIFVDEVERRGALLTKNRMVTVDRRETSMEGLTEKLEGGESAFHGLIKEDKNTILTPKVSITKEDLAEIPELRQLRGVIDRVAQEVKTAEGLDRYKMNRMLIEMRKDQYAIKNAFRKPIYPKTITKGSTVYNLESDTGYYNEDGDFVLVSENTLDLWNPKHISALLVNYSSIKQDTEDDMDSDLKWMLVDLERIIDKALADEPVLMEILIAKIDKLPNVDIQKLLEEKHDTSHSQEYISSLYRNKIPQLIVDKMKEEWVNYIYTNHMKGEYKTCTRCKETKLALNRYYSINRTATSKFYSVCKACRSKK